MKPTKKGKTLSKPSSNIFDGKLKVPPSILYVSDLSDDGSRETVRKGNSNNDKQPLKATAIAWSIAGKSSPSLAVALGSSDTEDNITRGAVVQWGMDFTDLIDQTLSCKPSHQIEHTSHLTCIAAHPEKTNSWGVGSTYGEVMVVDFSVEDGKCPMVACSKIGQYTHYEPISSVCWFRTESDSEWTLCSVGNDGRLIVWGSSLAYPVRCIPLRKNSVSVIATVLGARQSTRLQNGTIFVGSAGGSVMAHDICQPKKNTIRIPGCEMKWSANALTMISRIEQNKREEVVKKVENRAKQKKRKGVDCVAVLDAKLPFDLLFPSSTPSMDFSSHAAEVSVIESNPFYPNIIFSAGMDGAVKLYDTNLKCIVLEFHLPCPDKKEILSLPAIDAKWSPIRETLLAIATINDVFIWDISESIDFPVERLELPRDCNIVSISFGSKDSGLLAIGDDSGAMHLVRLQDSFRLPCLNTENIEMILGLK